MASRRAIDLADVWGTSAEAAGFTAQEAAGAALLILAQCITVTGTDVETAVEAASRDLRRYCRFFRGEQSPKWVEEVLKEEP